MLIITQIRHFINVVICSFECSDYYTCPHYYQSCLLFGWLVCHLPCTSIPDSSHWSHVCSVFEPFIFTSFTMLHHRLN